MKEHTLYKADTNRLRSRTQNIFFESKSKCSSSPKFNAWTRQRLFRVSWNLDCSQSPISGRTFSDFHFSYGESEGASVGKASWLYLASLSSFDSHARWQPVTQTARSRQPYGKIRDCEQSTWNPIPKLTIVLIWKTPGITHRFWERSHLSRLWQ